MKETIGLIPKSTKWFFVFNGVVSIAMGINLISGNNSWTHWTSILGIIFIMGGVILFFYGLMLFSPSNKLNPRIAFTEHGLIVKRDIFNKVISFDWTDVKEITYKTFELDIKLNDDSIKTLNLPTTADKSMTIKKNIRKFCDHKNIKIVGG